MTDLSRNEARTWIRAGGKWPAPLRLGGDLRAELSFWIDRRYPEEACGLLVGRATDTAVDVIRVEPARNLEQGRARDRFTLSPEDWVRIDDAARSAGLDVVGIWHSHPDHPALPSATDLASAWEGYAYLIVGVDPSGPREWRAWQLSGGAFVEQELRDPLSLTEADPR